MSAKRSIPKRADAGPFRVAGGSVGKFIKEYKNKSMNVARGTDGRFKALK